MTEPPIPSLPTPVDIERLKFTRAVVDETMRLYPPAFLIIRAASGPDTVGGMPVKKNDVMLIAPLN